MGPPGFDCLTVQVDSILFIPKLTLRNMPRKGSSKEMLEDKDINRWYHNVARGAEVTADTYLRRLRAYCKWANVEPLYLASMKQEDIYNQLLDFVTHEEKRGMAGSYIESSVKAVKSWLNYKGIQITRKIKVKGATRTPTLENERVPTQEELKKVFLSATPRDRVSCVIMAHSGVRPEVLGNYKGTDGLRIKDFPEMTIQQNIVEFDKVPTIVMIRPELSKSRIQYFSFLSEEGCVYLKAYLEERIRKGDVLENDTDIITSRNTDKKFIRALNIGDGIRNSIRKAGFRWRPYVLRAYCDTQLLLAESRGKMVHSYRQFLMGHKGDIEARYTTNKSRLPEELIEDMRNSYQKSQSFLQTYAGEDDDKRTEVFRRQLLSIIGMGNDEVETMDVLAMSNDDIMDQLRKKLGEEMTKNGNGQKVIDADQVEEYIDDGWDYVNNLPNGKVIMKLPLATFKLEPNGDLG
jgi:hypothetical protein